MTQLLRCRPLSIRAIDVVSSRWIAESDARAYGRRIRCLATAYSMQAPRICMLRTTANPLHPAPEVCEFATSPRCLTASRRPTSFLRSTLSRRAPYTPPAPPSPCSDGVPRAWRHLRRLPTATFSSANPRHMPAVHRRSRAPPLACAAPAIDLSASAPFLPAIAHHEYFGSGHSRRRLTRALAYINNTFTVIRCTYMCLSHHPQRLRFLAAPRGRCPMLLVLTQERLDAHRSLKTRAAAH
jgi:hypothetical protein